VSVGLQPPRPGPGRRRLSSGLLLIHDPKKVLERCSLGRGGSGGDPGLGVLITCFYDVPGSGGAVFVDGGGLDGGKWARTLGESS